MIGSEALISAENLTQIYPLKKGRQKTVFDHISLKIFAGEFVAFLGPSGCGKSTMLRLLSQLEKPTSGEVRFSPLLKTQSIVFQEPRLLPWRTVRENILLPCELGRNSKSEDLATQKADQLLQQLGIFEFSQQFPHELSGGMQMRTALARALLLEPELLLLDEPLAALDESTRSRLQWELRGLFEKLKSQNPVKTFVFVTHSIAEACFLADRIFIFNTQATSPQIFEVNLSQTRLDPKLRESELFFAEIKRLREYL